MTFVIRNFGRPSLVPIYTIMRNEGSWLLPAGVDRGRLLEMDCRLRPIRRRTFAVLGAGLLLASPWVGWWTIAPLVVAAGVFRVAEGLTERLAHPEYAIFAAWGSAQVIIAASVALTGSLREVTLAWLAIPTITLSARFSVRGIVAGVALTLALMLAVMLGTEPSVLWREPPIITAPALIVIASAMLSTALMRSDIEHRSEALIDPLTGMLNRNALSRRTEELEQQSQVSGDPVGVIMADVDHFKRINDSYGHAAGDAVLNDLAYLLRKKVRAFESVYRLGGEEFLILLPGANSRQTKHHADRLRRAVQATAVGNGHRITMSFGVAASRTASRFDYATVASQADSALYQAKRAGRNCVCAARPGAETPRRTTAADPYGVAAAVGAAA
jgi:diguanylate cyclase (GGDEF)-like protein